MSTFQYQALQKSGHQQKGMIEADSERHARQLLREQALIPIALHPLKKNQHLKHKHTLSTQDLCLLTRQLATLLNAGIPLEEALRGVEEQTAKDKTRQLMIGVRTKITEGYSLAQALGEYPYAFPELYRASVAAGEQTGRLDMILEKLADYTENQQKTKQKIQQAMIYPSLMVGISVLIVAFLLSFVVPKIIDVFNNSGQSLPTMTILLIQLSNFVKYDGLYTLLFLILLGFGFYKSLEKPGFRFHWHQVLLKLPITAYLIKSINVARYIHTFSILFAAGVSVLETMRVSTHLINNLVMQKAFDIATNRVREGAAIHQALQDTRFLDPMAIHLIACGEKSGQLAPMMVRAAEHLDVEVKRMIDTALILLEPLIILLMGGVVLFIVLATLLPIFTMEQLVV